MSRSVFVRLWPLVLIALTASLQATPATAEDILSERYSPDQHGKVQALEDPHGQWQISQVREHGDWRSVEGVFNQGYSRSIWWLRTTVYNPGSKGLTRYLEIGYPLLDQLDVYLLVEGEVSQHHSLGDKLPYASRLVDHQNFVIPVDIPVGAEISVYLRIQPGSIVQAPITFWSREQFLDANYDHLINKGLFLGALMLLAAYNLLLAMALRERAYLYYACYVLIMTAFLATLDGLVFRFMLPLSTYWNDQLAIITLAGLTAFAGLFARSLLEIPRLSRVLDRVTIAHISLAFLTIAVSFGVDYQVGIKLAMLVALTGSGLSLWAGPLAWMKQQPAGKYYTLAWSSLFACSFVHFAGRMGFIDSQWLTNNSMSIGVSAEVLLLSLALGKRINSERRQRVRAELEVLDAERRATAELEDRVQERTEQLVALNAQLTALSQTDQLTSLSNRRSFEERLNLELSRCRRSESPLSVVLLDIDHFKSVNDNWGHQVGDTCIQVVAGIIREAAGRLDGMAARYGGEEFCLLLPEVNASQAGVMAEELRAVVADTRIKGADGVTVSVGIASVIPKDGESAEQLLKDADSAMYCAKMAGRNQVRVIERQRHVFPVE